MLDQRQVHRDHLIAHLNATRILGVQPLEFVQQLVLMTTPAVRPTF